MALVRVGVFAAMVVALLAVFAVEPRTESLIYACCVFLLAQFVWSLATWRAVRGTLFDPYALALVAAFLFNAGQAFLQVFHLNEGGMLSGLFEAEQVLRTLILVIAGLAAFHCGALMAATAQRKKAGRASATGPSDDDVRLIGWILLVGSLIPAFILLRGAIGVVMSEGYFGLYRIAVPRGLGLAPQAVATFLVPSALFVLVGGNGRRLDTVVSAVVIAVYALVQFFLGSRGPATMSLVAFLWVWHRRIRRLPLVPILVGAALLLFVVFPTISVTRGLSGGERLSAQFLAESLFTVRNPAVATLSEMGLTMATVAHTLNLVPALRDFDRGAGYYYAARGILPNLLFGPDREYLFYGNWLVWTTEPTLAALGGGRGFSFIAEAYANFGWFGAPIALGLIGFLVARLFLWGDRPDRPARIALTGSFMCFFFIYARGESGSLVRYLVWYGVIPYLATYGVMLLRRRISARG